VRSSSPRAPALPGGDTRRHWRLEVVYVYTCHIPQGRVWLDRMRLDPVQPLAVADLGVMSHVTLMAVPLFAFMEDSFALLKGRYLDDIHKNRVV
jgi:hypothetical protein